MPESERTRAAHLQLLAVSWNFGWPVAAGVALGYWIDGHLGSSPAATLVLGIGALAAATWRLVMLSKQEEAAHRAEDAALPPPVAGAASESRSQQWDPETDQWSDEDDFDSDGNTPGSDQSDR